MVFSQTWVDYNSIVIELEARAGNCEIMRFNPVTPIDKWKVT